MKKKNCNSNTGKLEVSRQRGRDQRMMMPIFH